MQEASSTHSIITTDTSPEGDKNSVVSTHVLVEQIKVDQLRELSKRTRVAQSEYLREAVDDLLSKYQKNGTVL